MGKLQYTLVSNEDGQNITVFAGGGKPPLVAHSSHPRFDKIVSGALANDHGILDLFDLAAAAGSKFRRLTERVTALGGRLYLDGDEVDDTLSTQIVRFLDEDVPEAQWRSLVNFYENLQANPNPHSREHLYRWLKTGNFTITNDGMIVGYKGVRGGKSTRSGVAIVNGEVIKGFIPNAKGSLVEMPRGDVTFDPSNGCSTGLHVGTFSYARQYGDTVLEVHVNPRDVVSVPTDANDAKMRVCRYRVVGPVTKQHDKPIVADFVKRVESIREDAKEETAMQKPQTVASNDVFEDTDRRRAGRSFKVDSVEDVGGVKYAHGRSFPNNIKRTILVERLLSRKYKRV